MRRKSISWLGFQNQWLLKKRISNFENADLSNVCERSRGKISFCPTFVRPPVGKIFLLDAAPHRRRASASEIFSPEPRSRSRLVVCADPRRRLDAPGPRPDPGPALGRAAEPCSEPLGRPRTPSGGPPGAPPGVPGDPENP